MMDEARPSSRGPKRGHRYWVVWISGILGLVGLAWAVAILHVQSQVRGDLENVRRVHFAPPVPPGDDPLKAMSRWADGAGAVTRIHLHGCRALPGLMRELDSEDSGYLELISNLIHTAVMKSHFFERGTSLASDLIDRMNGMRVSKKDAPEDRARKVAALRTWWKAEGSNYHQWWRFWSTACRAPLSMDF